MEQGGKVWWEACWHRNHHRNTLNWVFGVNREGPGLQPGVSTPHCSRLLPSSWRLSRNVAALPPQQGRVWDLLPHGVLIQDSKRMRARSLWLYLMWAITTTDTVKSKLSRGHVQSDLFRYNYRDPHNLKSYTESLNLYS